MKLHFQATSRDPHAYFTGCTVVCALEISIDCAEPKEFLVIN